MKIVNVSGDTIPELISNLEKMFQKVGQEGRRSFIDRPDINGFIDRPQQKSHRPTSENVKEKPDISKVFWIDRTIDSRDSNKFITKFHVIAPFAINDSVKCSVKKINGEDWIYLTYENSNDLFKDCFMCNFVAKQKVEYKYNFHEFKIDRKKTRITMNNGVIELTVISSKIEPTEDDFVIGL